jgi:hypothetical protein
MGGTQQEFEHLLQTMPVKPTFLLDFSNGADALFSNFTITQLKSTHEKIDVYMEKGSANELMLNFFVKNN